MTKKRRNHPKPSPIKQETPQTRILKRRKHKKQPKEKKPDPKNQKKRKLLSGAAASKSTKHGRASRLIYVTLDPPREHAGYVDLEASRTSYGPR